MSLGNASCQLTDFLVMDENNYAHLTDASHDLFASIVSPAIEKILSGGALVTDIAKMPCVSALSIIFMFDNETRKRILRHDYNQSEAANSHVT